jgi:hypothetical protein
MVERQKRKYVGKKLDNIWLGASTCETEIDIQLSSISFNFVFSRGINPDCSEDVESPSDERIGSQERLKK